MALEKGGKKGLAISADTVLIPQNRLFPHFLQPGEHLKGKGEIHASNLTTLILRFKNLPSKGQLCLS